ncbi:hypothetical protein [Aestuariimicrobium sp. Y1814]|uniref:hypothetical protein n=1 Tax=Aestuariimicrobium sp. Y1814 TaxID=3418742 RepID=UPI003DA724B8
MGRELASNPCQTKCNWSARDEFIDGLRVFACSGCHSEWTAAEPWAPANVDGVQPTDVMAARIAYKMRTSDSH